MRFSGIADPVVWPPSLSRDRKWTCVTKSKHSLLRCHSLLYDDSRFRLESAFVQNCVFAFANNTQRRHRVFLFYIQLSARPLTLISHDATSLYSVKWFEWNLPQIVFIVWMGIAENVLKVLDSDHNDVLVESVRHLKLLNGLADWPAGYSGVTKGRWWGVDRPRWHHPGRGDTVMKVQIFWGVTVLSKWWHHQLPQRVTPNQA